MTKDGGLLERRLAGGGRWLFVGYAALACVVLLGAIVNLVADPTQWWWVLLVIGLGLAAMAVHPMTRTPLSWPEVPINQLETLFASQRGSWVNGVSRGGTIALTSHRLIFEPNSMEATLRVTGHDWALGDITGVDIAPRGGNLFGGGIRRRLRVLLRDGRRELFVLHDVETMRSKLIRAITDGQNL